MGHSLPPGPGSPGERRAPGTGWPGVEPAGAPRAFEPVGPEALREQLFEQRIVQLRGPLDDASAGRAAAELMALDALGDSSVQLYLDSSGGPLSSAFTLIDTIDLLGVPVHVTCVGRVEGTAVGVLAAGERRLAAPHARFHLVEPTWSAEGNATQLVGWVEHHQAELASFVKRARGGNWPSGRAPGG